jgi:hypothetical protein
MEMGRSGQRSAGIGERAMQASIEHLGSDLFCRSPQTEPQELRLDAASAHSALEAWAERYDAALRTGRVGASAGFGQPVDDTLRLIGRELFDWLDVTGWASAWAARAGSRALTIRVDDPSSAIGRALLDAPGSCSPAPTASWPTTPCSPSSWFGVSARWRQPPRRATPTSS